jgi:SNF2 family DNA or RNA helicase
MHVEINISHNSRIKPHSAVFFDSKNLSDLLNMSLDELITTYISDSPSLIQLFLHLKLVQFLNKSNEYIPNSLENYIIELPEKIQINFLHFVSLHHHSKKLDFKYENTRQFCHHVLKYIYRHKIDVKMNGEIQSEIVEFNSIALVHLNNNFLVLPFFSRKHSSHIAYKPLDVKYSEYKSNLNKVDIIKSSDLNDQLIELENRFIRVNETMGFYVDQVQIYKTNVLKDEPFPYLFKSSKIEDTLDFINSISLSMHMYFCLSALVFIAEIEKLEVDLYCDINNEDISITAMLNNETPLSPMQMKQILDQNAHFIEYSNGTFAYIDYHAVSQINQEIDQYQSAFRLKRSRIHQLFSMKNKFNLSFSDRLSRYLKQIDTNKINEIEINTSTINVELRPYQAFGIQWLKYQFSNQFGGILADDMGLGKTVQIISFLSTIPHSKVLIVVPKSLKRQWNYELNRFFSNYSSIHQLQVHHYHELYSNQQLFQYDWDIVIFDEIHILKNEKADISDIAKNLSRKITFGLTGTPFENNLFEYHHLFEIVLPGLFDPRKDFTRKYIKPYEHYLRKGATDQANQIIEHIKAVSRPFILKRSKYNPDVISEIPKRMNTTISCELNKTQIQEYKSIIRDHKLSLHQNKKSTPIITLILRLKQFCNSFSDHEYGKFYHVRKIIKNAKIRNEKVIVFTQFKDTILEIQNDLETQLKIPCLSFHGEHDSEERENIINQFKTNRGTIILVLSLKAGGVGLNLTEANHVIHFDRWWNPAVENQASDRAHRIGQTKPVTIYTLVTANTVEEHIDRRIQNKSLLFDQFFSEDSFSHADINELESMISNYRNV